MNHTVLKSRGCESRGKVFVGKKNQNQQKNTHTKSYLLETKYLWKPIEDIINCGLSFCPNPQEFIYLNMFFFLLFFLSSNC